MNRLVIFILLSVFSFGVHAQYTESSYSVISHRQYSAQGSYAQIDQSYYGGVYQTSTHSSYYGTERSDDYQSSYHSDNGYQDRISANTFSSTPSMEINTMLPTQDEECQGYGNRRRSSGVRPPQRGVDGEDQGDTDLKEPETNDPNATPLGDTPWVLMLLLVLGCALRQGKKHGSQRPAAGNKR